ncbi:MAG: hypothetical protein KBA33_02205 [Cloacibacterium sp.]|nr:hypothetical protein [Cloacibacterium sp.]
MKIFPFFFLFVFGIGSAQILDNMAFSVNYRYLGRNALGTGIEFRLSDRNVATTNLGVQVLYTSNNGHAKFIPEIHIARAFSNSSLFFAGLSVNPYAVEPQVGFNLLNMLSLNTGYALPIHKEKYFRGVTFGFQMNIAPTKRSKFYNTLNVIQ